MNYQKPTQELIRKNNPENKPTGAYTGRCAKCASSDLWDDCSAYGCNCCGATFDNRAVQLVRSVP